MSGPADVLRLPQAMLDQIAEHARRDHPDECCGIVSGRSGRPSRLVEMVNAERSPTGFAFDSAQWLQVSRELDDAGEDLLVVYHSHTMTEAYPSRTDIAWSANTPGACWLLVSTRQPDVLEVRAFRIGPDAVVREQRLAAG